MSILSQVEQVSIDEHGEERWNERVGPSATLEQLSSLIESLIEEPDRLTFYPDGHGLIDGDIVFTYEIRDGGSHLAITTFYGRISLNPILRNWDTLRRYNSFWEESVNLRVEEFVLAKQKLPFLPDRVYYFLVRNVLFKVEKHDKNCFLVQLENTSGGVIVARVDRKNIDSLVERRINAYYLEEIRQKINKGGFYVCDL